MKRLLFIALFVGVTVNLSQAAVLDSPSHGATLSGLGFISGWKCDAGEITVRINDGGHIPMAEGQPRDDTRLICGTTDNGFITQVNWNHLGDSTHTAVAYDDGVEFARSTFTVVTAGEEFLDQAPGTAYAANWPSAGENARLVWNESTQHFELAEVGSHVVIPDPNSPEPTPPLVQGKIYWMVSDAIQRANLDGSQVETLVTIPRWSGDLALDRLGRKLYWADWDSGTGKIRRANLDGSQVETFSIGVHIVASIALDLDGGKLYWTNRGVYTGGVDAIQRANLDGSEVETLVTTGLENPRGLALDLDGGKMYWTIWPRDGVKIQRANLDGSEVETLVTMEPNNSSGLALDPTGGKLYWTHSSDAIQRANLDGSQVETLVTGLGEPRGLALDLVGSKLYWTTYRGGMGAIQRANLDGSQVETLVTGLAFPYNLALDLK